MASCRDCVHYEACEFNSFFYGGKHGEEKFKEYENSMLIEFACQNFKDKSRFVEIPCDVGDCLYLPCCGEIIELQVFEIQIKHIFVDYSTGVIKNIIALNENGASMELKFKDIGKIVFLTREEAEKALKERKRHGSLKQVNKRYNDSGRNTQPRKAVGRNDRFENRRPR